MRPSGAVRAVAVLAILLVAGCACPQPGSTVLSVRCGDEAAYWGCPGVRYELEHWLGCDRQDWAPAHGRWWVQVDPADWWSPREWAGPLDEDGGLLMWATTDGMLFVLLEQDG